MANSPSKRAAARVVLINGQPTTTSRNIAETFGKSHVEIVRRIKRMQCSEAFGSAHFCAHPYTNPQNGQTYTEYLITRDGFAFLCMGFTGAKAAQWKERYINTFNKMAERLAAKAAPAPLPPVISPSVPAVGLPTLMNRRYVVDFVNGVERVFPLNARDAVIDPNNAQDLQVVIEKLIPDHMLSLVLEVAAKRAGRVFGGKALSLT